MLSNFITVMLYIIAGSIVIISICAAYFKLEKLYANRNYRTIVQNVPEKVQTYAFRHVYRPELVKVPVNPEEPVTFNKNVKVFESEEGGLVYTDGPLYRSDVVFYTENAVKYAISYDGNGGFEVRCRD